MLIAVVLLFTANNYQAAFAVLIIPFILMMIAIAYTYRKVGKGIEVEVQSVKQEKATLSRGFWFYCVAVFLSTLGLIPVALILFSGSTILKPLSQAWMIPILYAIVQAVDAPTALVSGHLFDKLGIKLLALPFALAVLPVFFVSYGGLFGIVVACLTFGLVLGMQDSIYPAAVCELIPLGRRGTAYGVFNAILGFGSLSSGVIFGYFLDMGYPLVVLVGFALPLQLGAILTLSRNKKLLQSFKKTSQKTTTSADESSGQND